MARRWRNAEPASVITLDDHAGTVFGVSTIPGSPNLLASGGEDAILRLWNTATSRVVYAEPSSNLSARPPSALRAQPPARPRPRCPKGASEASRGPGGCVAPITEC